MTEGRPLTRAEQKERTRSSLVSAAAQMIRDGVQPTVAEAAKSAGVHRATAYRYFPTPQSLLAEASLQDLLPTPDHVLDDTHDDPEAIIDAAVEAIARVMFTEEAMFRTVVQVTVDRWFQEQATDHPDQMAVRHTRRFEWIDRALEPLRGTLPPDRIFLLRNALAMTFGSEAVIVLRDVCELDPDDATRVMRWMARTLVQGAVRDATDPP